MMIVNQRAHWDSVYTTKPADQVGWYRPHLEISSNWIAEIGFSKDAPIIDIGGGASTLVDDLLDEGYESVTVLDISAKALSVAKTRLGRRAERVTWLEKDITSMDLSGHAYAIWHDRAVFHFLTEPEQRDRYAANLTKALKPGGHMIIGVFSPEAPPMCSGLPVQRYSSESLQQAMGDQLELRRYEKVLHLTPGGVEQMYLYCDFRRTL